MASSPAFQAGNAGFESRWDHCGCRTMAVPQIVDLKIGVRVPTVTSYAACPGGEGAVLKTVGP